jgi:hypothetical protein
MPDTHTQEWCVVHRKILDSQLNKLTISKTCPSQSESESESESERVCVGVCG